MGRNTLLIEPDSGVRAAVKAAAKSERIVLIDMLRGVAMILMALDHSGAFAKGGGYVAEGYAGQKPELSSLPHVLTGLVTNVATPIFYLLTGVSVAFFEHSRRKRGWKEWQITRFLLIRALILLALDQFLVRFAWNDPPSLDVLSAIAFALVVLSVIRLLPLKAVALIGFAVFLGTPFVVQQIGLSPEQPVPFVLRALFVYDVASVPWVEFPLLGWPVLTLFGYVIGRLLQARRVTISPRLLWVAAASFALWFVLRVGGGYGNYLPYHGDWSPIYFFVENKQPPSIVYILFNFAWGVCILVLLERFQRRFPGSFIEHVLTIFGQTALFFYVAHLLLYSDLVSRVIPPTFLNGMVAGGLFRSYLEFAVGLVILYPLCFGYYCLRRAHPDSILRYL